LEIPSNGYGHTSILLDSLRFVYRVDEPAERKPYP
jgi:hypothetical protein